MSPKMKHALNAFLVVAIAGPLSTSSAHAKRDKYIKMAEELQLTAAQREQLEKIRGEYKKTLPGKREAMEAKRDEMEKALRGTNPDAEVRKKFDELEKAQADFAKSRFEKILAIRAILTPEQRQKFKAFDDKDKPWKRHKKDSEEEKSE